MHVIINGVSSETLQGVQVLSLPPITKPRMRTSVAVIDGRPGDIVTRLGYEAYNRKIRILLHHDYDIDAISAFFNTSGTIIFSNEPDMEYEFETIDAFSFERAVQYKTADITFHVQPYKLGATEEPTTGDVSTLVDRTPYIIRRTPFGTRQKGTIVGGSVVWNQLFVPQTRGGSVGVSTSATGDGAIRIYGTATAIAWLQMNDTARPIVGHKYFADKGSDSDLYSFSNDNKGIHTGYGKRYTIGNPTTNQYMYFVVANGTTIDVTVRPKLIDLTLMFGSEIADYIYTQEQATAGAGVALAKAWAGIIADYYPYDPGTIKSVTGLTAHRMTGFNQWDEEWEVGGLSPTNGANISATDRIRSKNYIRVIPNTEYYFGYFGEAVPLFYICYYDAEKAFIERITQQKNKTLTIPNNCYYIRFFLHSGVTSYSNDTCINISDPAKNGTYEPYTAHTYPLDSSLSLQGLPKLDEGSLYYDGDIYPSSGEVGRRYRLFDLGAQTWIVNTTGMGTRMQATIPGIKNYEGWSYTHIICSRYPAQNINVGPYIDKSIGQYNDRILIYDSAYANATAAEFKAAMSGVMLLCELAEPTTEQAEPYTALQICDPAGTEEFVGASIPVGHETTYIDPISMTVTNEGNTTSAPSITIEGEGTVEVTVDGLNILQIQMPASGEITIDSKTLDATDGEGGLANRSATGDYNDLHLAPGEHTVTVTGDVTSVTLKNTSRWI